MDRNLFSTSLIVLVTAMATLALGGCDRLGTGSFIAGTYTGNLSCRLVATDSTGMEQEETFDVATTVVIDADGSFSIDDITLAIGGMVRRSIPTAELDFEITELVAQDDRLSFTAEPRPTLPGITATGELIESYRAAGGSIDASRELDIEITDIEGTIVITGTCEGALTAE